MMNPEERKEETGISAQIEILEENLELASERVKDIEDEIAHWQGEQRPSQQSSIPPFQAEMLARAKTIAAKHKERLQDFEAQLRDLHLAVKARKEAEEAAECARAAEIPRKAQQIADKVHEIDPDDFEILYRIARAKKAAATVFNAREKFDQLEVERAFFIQAKGHEISELAEVTWPVCLDELRSTYRAASDIEYEIKRTAPSRKRTSEIAQMKGALRDLAADG
jgi:hypothetical protein